MNEPLFSIIVPVYKVEKYISKCIDSIINQTYKDFELILVDDGSPDACPAICDEYAQMDRRVKVIHKQNGGLVLARKAGSGIANGDYVICVDSDDWVDKDFLIWAEQIVSQYNPDIICFGYYEASGDKCIEKQMQNCSRFYDKNAIKEKIYPFLIEDKNAASFTPSVWGKVYKRDIYTKYQNSVPSSVKIGEDSAVVIPCVYNADSLYIDNHCVYYYRYNPTSITKSKKAFAWDEPRIRAEYLSQQVNMEEGDFRQQLYRFIVHSVFNVAVSQFNRKEKFSVISKDIKSKIDTNIYAEAIEKASFQSFKGKIAQMALKHKWIFLMRMYNRLCF